MPDAQITFISQDLPEGVCPTTEQERFNLYTEYLSGYLPGDYTTINTGPDQPSVDDQDKPWLRTNADGTYDRLYTFSGGAWTAPHPIPPGPNGHRMLWADSLANLATFDGGDAGAITATTGSFWEQDTAFTDKIPKGVGVTAVNVDASELSSGASATDQIRGIYFVKRSIRAYYTV